VGAHTASRLVQTNRPDQAKTGRHQHLGCSPRGLPLKTTPTQVPRLWPPSPGPPEPRHYLARSV